MADLHSDGGSTIDQYVIRRLLGSGGMADVYLAWDQQNQWPVALKLIHSAAMNSANLRERFRREVLIAQQFHNPHLVQVYGSGSAADGRPYMVMEYVDGGSLADLLERQADAGGVLPPEHAVYLLRRVAGAMAYAHAKGVIHRDLKPSNVLIRKESGEPVVTDLGIASVSGANPITGTLETLGTPQYMAPEQAEGRQEIDQRADIYALGVMGYEMLSGRRPFEADNVLAILNLKLNTDPIPLRQLRPNLDRGLVAVIEKSMQRDPAKRYTTAGALAAALDPYMPASPDEPPQQPYRTELAPSAQPTKRRSSTGLVWIAGGAAVLLLLLLFANNLFGGGKGPAAATPAAPPATIAQGGGEDDESLPVMGATATLAAVDPTFTPPGVVASPPNGSDSSVVPISTLEGTAEHATNVILSDLEIPIALGQAANSDQDFVSPLAGDLVFDDISFSIGPRIFKSQASGGSSGLPTNIYIPIGQSNVGRLHLLLSAGNGFNRFSGSVIGQVTAFCDGQAVPVAALRLGQNIREWHSANNVVSSAPDTREVWQGAIAGAVGEVGHVDLLTLDLPAACDGRLLTAVEIRDVSQDEVGSLDPALNLSGLALSVAESADPTPVIQGTPQPTAAVSPTEAAPPVLSSVFDDLEPACTGGSLATYDGNAAVPLSWRWNGQLAGNGDYLEIRINGRSVGAVPPSAQGPQGWNFMIPVNVFREDGQSEYRWEVVHMMADGQTKLAGSAAGCFAVAGGGQAPPPPTLVPLTDVPPTDVAPTSKPPTPTRED